MKIPNYKLLLFVLLIVGYEETTEPEDCAGVAGGTAVEDDVISATGGVRYIIPGKGDYLEAE